MLGKGLRLYKREKLCSVTAIDRLFAARSSRGEIISDRYGDVASALAYPIRMVFGTNRARGGAPVKFLISVPKKKLRRAVDRVTMRRRIREAYRNARGSVENIADTGIRTDVVFIYIADRLVDYSRIEKSMTRLINLLPQ